MYPKPWISFLWSAMFPGFGQLYNRDYIMGITLLILETVINYMAKLNLCIYYVFNGDFEQALKNIDFQWILFYPAIWSFSMWQAYDYAVAIKTYHEFSGMPKQQRSNNAGAFIGLNLGLLFGTLWHHQLIIFWGLGMGAAGFIVGYYIEKVLRCKR
ncbi:hypothetical protein SPACI_048750 [Sporomusa acidovorans DSM 3132]|uniref:DUF5683 domain-containing protein n=2 Tax=Sporomusa TaxID=2375 RepID=A0ABZ3J8P3_SPOA4|nr:hypothetical protein [Sporomusa acidovorans]OZC16154.1 hypothetical protein SPACI_45210 [Sporomusa acidovorans DSM 3132]SDE29305.1 hypothetical protein SAMN04488499_101119 [Sporomusa acidovorans]